MVDGLRRALGFLTIYPLRESESWTPDALGNSMVYYPLVGTGIGCLLWMLYLFLGTLFPLPLVSVLLLVGLYFLTGGLHIDNLTDTISSLGSGYNREATLRLLKDPHLDALGIVSVVLLLLVKYVSLSVLPYEGMLSALVLMGTLSRYAMVQLARFSAYARIPGGRSEPFVQGIRQEHFVVALLWTLSTTLLFGGVSGLMIGMLVSIITLGLQVYFDHRLGGITGDVLGAMAEIGETLVLVMMTTIY